MTLPIALLSVAVALCAALTIAAKYRQSKRLEYICKPLATASILLIALLADDPISTRYQLLIALGLVASLLGDIFLMLPEHFLPGLASFLVAHLAYIAAFTLEGRGTAPLWYLAPFVLYGALMLHWLWPHLGSLRGPVIVYMVVILLMAWQAANRWIETRQDGTLLALAGAYLFVTSDSALAVERFRGAWRSAPFWVLSTYFAAQWLIALSV
ncbi:MAG: lysoplasmalogenase [Anaerolineae bacterium]|nr:lysoplasmalogenase [Anaerolineae bacterium]